VLFVDEVGGTATLQDCTQHQIKPEVEVRLLIQRDNGSFFLVQRNRIAHMFGSGSGVAEALGLDVSMGVIWSEADNLYLDAEVAYRRTFCRAESCSPLQMLQPRILLTAKL
jgi:hypothetical protein